MGLADKIRQLAREEADKAYRDLAAMTASTSQAPATLAKVVAVSESKYTVLLASGEFQQASAGGSRPIALGESYHIIGGVIF